MMKENNVNLTIDEIKRRVMQLHPGDLVEFETDDEIVVATLVKINKNLVEFRKENGMRVSLSYFDAMHVNVIRPSGFESYNEQMAIRDFTNALKE